MVSQTRGRLDRCYLIPQFSREHIPFSLSFYHALMFTHRPDFTFMLEKFICHHLERRKILNFYNYLCIKKAQVFDLVFRVLFEFFGVEFQSYQFNFESSQLP